MARGEGGNFFGHGEQTQDPLQPQRIKRALIVIAETRTLWKIFKRRYPSSLSRNDIVLDIGSGDRPHPRANILIERFIDDSSQRGGPVVTEGRPLVIGDITALPFLHGSIDYIICSHVLEHMESDGQLEQALNELMRVGRRGYIETPSETFEKLLGAPYHHWYVRREGEKIIFRRKREYAEYEDLMRVFLPLHRDSKTFFRFLFENFDNFFVSTQWEKKIDYSIDAALAGKDAKLGGDYPSDLSSGFHRLGEPHRREHHARMMLKRLIHKIVNRGAKVDLYSILACPVCQQKLIPEQHQNTLQCAHCRLKYPIRNGVPIMLRAQAVKI